MAQIESEKANVENAKAALRVAETNLRYTTIRSPVTGIVISRNVDVGQTVAASLQAPTLFTIAKDLTQMQVDTNFSEADIGRIEEGQEATFTVDAYPEYTFRGRVWQIRNAPQTVQNVVTYDVVIKVENPELKLKPGMTANVTIVVDRRENVLKIPNAALRFRPQGIGPEGLGKVSRKSFPGSQGKPGTVWVLGGDGKIFPVPIRLGITDGSFSEVVSGDLKEGMEIVVEEISSKKGQSSSSPPPFMRRGLGK